MTDITSDTDHSPAEATLDVVVIGMGPVGKMAALLLARAGHLVLVTERKERGYPLPRAVAHDAEVARILQNAGLPVDSMPDAVEPYDDLYVWVNGDDEVLHEVDWTGTDPSGWNNTYFYNQPALEAHLDERVHAQPTVRIERGVSARVAGQDDDGADVVIRVDATGAERTERARYVLAADGAGSATRESLGIDWNDLGYFFDWLVVDVLPGEGFSVTHLAKQVADPARPTTVVPAGPGRRRWEFMLLPGESAAELTEPARIWELLQPFGVRPDNASIERGVVYTFNSGWAGQWHQDRVFLLGDAAHQMPPFAGQGLAAGFRDCLNLAWKLDLVLRGEAAPALLSTYTTERTMHVSDFIQFSMALGRIICILDPDEARARDEAMLADRASGRTPEPPPAPRLGPGLHRGETGGYLSWQGRVTAPGRTEVARFDDLFGAGALVLDDAALASELGSTTGDLAALGIRTVAFGGSSGGAEPAGIGRFDDVAGSYAEWFRLLDAHAVLVRPDFAVFGTASDAEGVARLVADFVAGVRDTVAVDTVAEDEESALLAGRP